MVYRFLGIGEGESGTKTKNRGKGCRALSGRVLFGEKERIANDGER
jgi:hypothetical protein